MRRALLALVLCVTASAIGQSTKADEVRLGEFSGYQSISQEDITPDVVCLAYTIWPKGKEAISRIIFYRKSGPTKLPIYTRNFPGAYSAKLEVAYDTKQDGLPIIVFLINYGAACQKALIHTMKDNRPALVQDMESGWFQVTTRSDGTIELHESGPSTADSDEIYKWSGTLFNKIQR